MLAIDEQLLLSLSELSEIVSDRFKIALFFRLFPAAHYDSFHFVRHPVGLQESSVLSSMVSRLREPQV